MLGKPNTTDLEFLNLRVRLLAQQAIRVPLVLLAIGLIVGFAIKDAVDRYSLIIWLSFFVGASIPRALFAKWRLSQPDDLIHASRHYWLFVLFAILNGLGAGISAPLFFPTLSAAEQAFIGMVLTGLVAGGVATSGSSPLVLAAYALSALLPLGFAWNYYGNDRSHLVTWLIVVFSAMMVVYARDGKKVLYQSFLIRRQRDEANALLQQKNEELSQAKAAIENLAQTKTRVLAAASHDLRQPLHALSIYSAVLSASPSQDTLKEIGHNINQLVGSLAALLDALLDLSQLDNQSFPIQYAQLDLANVAQKIAQELKHRTETKGLTLELQLEPAPVFNDPLILERIIRNLADNAVKYTDQGFVRISTLQKGGLAYLEISDSGRGIAPDQLDRVFEEFYQVDNPGRDRSLGLGLGLSIVQRMTKLIQAELRVDSRVGRGTSFTLQLPTHQPKQAEHHDELPHKELLKGKTILLIDDEYSIIASMTSLLNLWGARTLSACDMDQALEIIKDDSLIDFIIADLRLKQGENGVTVIQNLRQILGEVPALIISGETSPERLLDAKNVGLTVLQKPVSADQLSLQLSKLLNQIP